MALNKALKTFIALLLLILLWEHLGLLWHMVVKLNDGWILGDWLINYQDGGFKRRGLSGTFFFLLQDITGQSLPHLVFGFIAVLYVLFYALVFLLLKNKTIRLLYLLFLLAPVTLSFAIYNVECVGRKELLLFLLAALYVWLLNKDLIKNTGALVCFIILVLIATLLHEVFFFYTPYFLFFTHIYNKQNKEAFNYRPGIAIITASFLAFALAFFIGGPINQGKSLQLFLSRGLDERVMGGIFTQPELNVSVFAEHYHYYGYFFSCILGLVPFVLFFKKRTATNNVDSKQKKKIKSIQKPLTFNGVLLFIFFLFFFSLPLFATAVDWGRWLNIHFVLLTLGCSLLLESQNQTVTDTFFLNDLNLSKALPWLLASLLYIFIWRMPHCCSTGIAFATDNLSFHYHAIVHKFN